MEGGEGANLNMEGGANLNMEEEGGGANYCSWTLINFSRLSKSEITL